MDFGEWKEAVAVELLKLFGMPIEDARRYITDSEQCWREMFADGLTPSEAAEEEADAAAWCEAC